MQVTMREMLEAGVHFGHQTRFWNPQMAPYIFGESNKIHIINLEKTLPLYLEALAFVRNIVADGGTVRSMLGQIGRRQDHSGRMQGEVAGCGSAHPDNVAPSLYGGFVLARAVQPPDVIRLPVPDGLACAVLHPHLEVQTGAARALLGETVPLEDAVADMINGVVYNTTADLLGVDLAEVDVAGIIVAFIERLAGPGAAAGAQEGLRRAGAGRGSSRATSPSALPCTSSGSGPARFAFGPARAVGRRDERAASPCSRSAQSRMRGRRQASQDLPSHRRASTLRGESAGGADQ